LLLLPLLPLLLLFSLVPLLLCSLMFLLCQHQQRQAPEVASC
jgi:hypothetical protein